MTPRIGIIPGDPSGIGPELIAKLMAAEGVREAAEILLIGDRCVLEQGMRQAGAEYALVPVDLEDWRAPPEGIAWLETEVAVETEASGRSVLATMDRALELLQAGHIDGLVFAPFNKAAMHMAGLAHADELHHMGERLGVTEYLSELNVLDGMWTSRTTSHIALRDVADAITPERLEEAVVLIDRTLRRSGIARPRISVAALNPHAGDGGNFGREEIDVPRPAIEAMQKRQMPVDGPGPSDAVFLKLRDVEIDAVVTMYHDQGQIALKLLGFERGVTVQGGLPYPVTTPAHGTAFDIAGQGRARVDAMRQAFDIARDRVANWQ